MTQAIDLPPQYAELSRHRLEQYFQPFAMEERAFNGLYRAINSIDLSRHAEAGAFDPEFIAAAASEGISADWIVSRSGKPGSKAKDVADQVYSVDKQNGIAIFEMRGTLTKYGSSFSSVPGMVRVARGLQSAVRNQDVKSILLVLDSPGGTAAGSQQLAASIANAAQVKPVYAWCDDLAASAAYRLASQATKVYASRDAQIGSIGTYLVVTDWSRAAMEEGAKVHVIKAGEYKGAGVPGTEITEKQLASWQEMVNAINDGFLADVATGRKMTREQVQALADGRVHIASAAEKLGLVDGIRALEEVVGEMAPTKRKGKAMTQEASEGPRAASLKELKNAFPQASEAFLLDCLEREKTLDQASTAWSEHQQKEIVRLTSENETLKAEVAELKEKVEKAGKGLKAVEGQSTDGQGAGSVYEEWQSLVQEKVKGGMTQVNALKAVDASHPGLRQRAIEDHNASVKASQKQR